MSDEPDFAAIRRALLAGEGIQGAGKLVVTLIDRLEAAPQLTVDRVIAVLKKTIDMTRNEHEQRAIILMVNVLLEMEPPSA